MQKHIWHRKKSAKTSSKSATTGKHSMMIFWKGIWESEIETRLSDVTILVNSDPDFSILTQTQDRESLTSYYQRFCQQSRWTFLRLTRILFETRVLYSTKNLHINYMWRKLYAREIDHKWQSVRDAVMRQRKVAMTIFSVLSKARTHSDRTDNL